MLSAHLIHPSTTVTHTCDAQVVVSWWAIGANSVPGLKGFGSPENRPEKSRNLVIFGHMQLLDMVSSLEMCHFYRCLATSYPFISDTAQKILIYHLGVWSMEDYAFLMISSCKVSIWKSNEGVCLPWSSCSDSSLCGTGRSLDSGCQSPRQLCNWSWQSWASVQIFGLRAAIFRLAA